MKQQHSMKRRRIWAVLATSAMVGGLSACAGDPSPGESNTGDTGSNDSEVTSLTIWDYFAHLDGDSHLAELYNTCGDSLGITIERTADGALNDNLLQAASGGSTPDLVIMDNPNIAEFADIGLLVPNSVSGLDASGQSDNILAAAQVGGETYGASIGANTLALFYNTEMLAAAGLDAPTNWDELKEAAAATTQGDTYGIAFSAIAGEEASFQFEPFLWGSGAALEALDSPDSVEALQLWTDWIANGQASQANLNANQQEVRDQFTSGNAAMMVNGTWQLNPVNESGIPYAVVPVPSRDGGPAPSPLGGEFIQVVTGDDANVQAAGKFAQCLVDPVNLDAWIAAQSYISPYPADAEAQAAADSALVPWVEAIGVAKGRTSDLGAAYPGVSNALSTAIQEALSGTKTPEEALTDAQASAG